MFKKIELLLLLLVGASWQSMAQDNTLAPSIYVSSDWEQGGIGTIIIYPLSEITSVDVALLDQTGKTKVITKVVPHTIAKGNKTYVVGVALLGLYPAFGYGDFTLKIDGKASFGEFSKKQTVSVAENEYKVTRIKMGAQGTRVINDVSVERQDQARRFFAALQQFNLQSIFYTGKFQVPVNSSQWVITGRYWDTRLFTYANGKTSVDIHNGLDFANMKVGTPVLAVGTGRVVLAENRIITGNTVILEHFPGVFSLYYHLESISVKVGKQVKVGKTIGRLGSTGFATGPHVHLGVRVSNVDIDPMWTLTHKLIDDDWVIEVISATAALTDE